MKEDKIYSLLYLRVSSKRQEVEGSGLDSQEHRCKKLSDDNQYEFEKAFRDSFTGGGDFMQRPAMRALLEHIDSNPHKNYVVIFDDLKRFARDVQAHIQLKKVFKNRGVLLKCPNYDFDDSPEGQFVEVVLAGQAELERKQNTRQVVQKMKACLESGRWVFGGKKIGYIRKIDPLTKNKILVPDENASVVKEALEGFAYRRFLRKIEVARFLKERGVFGNAPVETYLDTVSSMLSDIFYTAYIEFPAWDVKKTKAQHKALITSEVFELNQKRLRGETQGKRIRNIHNSDFVLGGLVECPECQRTLRYYWSKGRKKSYPYYECKTKNCSLKGQIISRELLESEFNQIIIDCKPREGLIEVSKEIFNDTWNEELKETFLEEKEIQKEKSELEKEFEAIAKKASKAPEGSSLERQFSKLMETNARKIEDLENSLNKKIDYAVPYRTALDRVLNTLKKPLEMWLSADIFQKQRLFFFLFDRKLQYVKGEGYRTAQPSLILRLFNRFNDKNSLDVEMAGIEPASK